MQSYAVIRSLAHDRRIVKCENWREFEVWPGSRAKMHVPGTPYVPGILRASSLVRRSERHRCDQCSVVGAC